MGDKGCPHQKSTYVNSQVRSPLGFLLLSTLFTRRGNDSGNDTPFPSL